MTRRDPSVTSMIMARVPKKNTRPELLIRSLLWKQGYRYRLHYSKLRGSPDVVFVKSKLAVFVDGDFWHGNAWKVRGLNNLADMFPTNTEWWVKKITRNMNRDQETTRYLQEQGWTVLRFWESEIQKDTQAVLTVIKEALARR